MFSYNQNLIKTKRQNYLLQHIIEKLSFLVILLNSTSKKHGTEASYKRVGFYKLLKACTTKGRFRSVNQGLNDEDRCCEVHAQTLPKIPTLAATDWLLMRYASVTNFQKKNC